MGPIISPRELAAAIGVSESSLKRWADDGQIRVSRTAGGHRRITIGDAIRFVRAIGAPLVRPELLGLRDLPPPHEGLLSADAPADRLFQLLVEGKAKDVRGLVLSLYLEGRSVAEIADGPIRAAMERLGELWKHDETGIYVEHRATDVCVQAVEHLRQFVEPDTPRAVAVGGAFPGDLYLLPTLLVATALEGEGWRAVNLGPNTPFEALVSACQHFKPALVWISVSPAREAAEIEQIVARLIDHLPTPLTRIALGGQGLPHSLAFDHPSVHQCRLLADLLTLARQLGGSDITEQQSG